MAGKTMHPFFHDSERCSLRIVRVASRSYIVRADKSHRTGAWGFRESVSMSSLLVLSDVLSCIRRME